MHFATEVLGRDSRGFLYRANKQEIDIKNKNLGGKQKYFCNVSKANCHRPRYLRITEFERISYTRYRLGIVKQRVLNESSTLYIQIHYENYLHSSLFNASQYSRPRFLVRSCLLINRLNSLGNQGSLPVSKRRSVFKTFNYLSPFLLG